MANKVEIIVVAKDQTGPTFAAVEAKAKAAGEKAGTQAGDGIKKGIDNSLKDAGNGGALEQKFEQIGTDAGKSLGDGISKGFEGGKGVVVGDAEKLGKEAGQAVSKGIEAGLGDGDGGGSPIRKRASSWLADAVSVGKEMGTSLAQGISSAFSGGGGAITTGLWAGLIASAVVASPLIAAALAGAIAGAGVLSVAIGGAILAAATSTEVQNAGKQLGENILGQLGANANGFVQPLLTAIDLIQAKVSSAGPLLTNLFDNAAQAIVPLTDSILDATEEIAGGLNSLFEASGPELVAELDNGIRQLGDALGYMFEQFGQSEGVADGLGTIFALISGGVVVATDALTTLADVYHSVIETIREFDQAIDPQEGKWIQIKDATDQAAEAQKRWATAIAEAVPTAQELIDANQGMLDPLAKYEKTVDNVASKQEKFNKAVAEFGVNSPQAALAGTQLAQAIQQQADAAQQAVGAYQGWTPELQAWAEAAGLSSEQINQLKASLDAALASAQSFAIEWVATFIADTAEANAKIEEAQNKVTVLAKTWTLQIAADNADALAKTAAAQAAVQAVAKTWQARIQVEAAQAMSAIGGVANGLAGLPSSKTISINIVTSGGGALAGLRTGGNARIGKAATGGIRSNMTLVGEEGPELVRLPYGSSVLPAGQSRRMMREQTEQDRRVAAEAEGPKSDWGREVTDAIRDLGRDIRSMKLTINERVIGGIQGYEADLYGRAG